MINDIAISDALVFLKGLTDGMVNCIVTSPPYFRLRDYGVDGQIGLEDTPEAYINRLVIIFREAWRVLQDDGTLWINIGDSYADKNLVGIPWRLALALQADGWILRSDIIWNKPNPMPESVTDRPTKAHEYVFLFAKSERYFYDQGAVREPLAYPNEKRRPLGSNGAWQLDKRNQGDNGGGKPYAGYPEARNKRSVWTIATQPYSEAHFATFPPSLIEPMIKAGCPEEGIVLDPFMGAGTTALVARRLGRNYIGCDLNPEYVEMARKRIAQDDPFQATEHDTGDKQLSLFEG